MIYLSNFSYNLDVAKVFGVKASIFLSCIDNQYNYQFRNNLLNANNTTAISRSEIYELTGLDDSEQIEVEIALSECSVLTVKPLQNVPNKNYYILDKDQLIKIITSDKP